MTDNDITRLRAFVDTLEDTLGWQFDLDDFDDRVRLQKYVFLADAFGFEHDYEYSIYHYGPYAPALADDYYSDTFTEATADSVDLSAFDSAAFSEAISDRPRKWLEIGATVKSLHTRYAGSGGADYRSDVIKRTSELKDVPEFGAEWVYDELQDMNVI